MATAEQVVFLARSQVGETSGAKYWNSVFPSWAFVSGSKTPWCACFVSWVFAQAGQDLPGLPSGYCPAIRNACAKAGRLVNKRTARVGDVVFFDWDGGVVDHVGIVAENNGIFLTVIEGNTAGSRVAVRQRLWSSVESVARPLYGSKSGDLLNVDGWWGPATTTRAQQVVGTPVDGVVSSQAAFWRDLGTLRACNDSSWEFVARPQGSLLVQALQMRFGCSVDGVFGRESVNAMERYYGIFQDGHFDGPSATVAAFQAALNRGAI